MYIWLVTAKTYYVEVTIYDYLTKNASFKIKSPA